MSHRQLARPAYFGNAGSCRQLYSPLTSVQLTKSVEDYERLQVDGELTQADCAVLDGFLAAHPTKLFRVYHRHDEPLYDLAFLRWLPALRELWLEVGAGELNDLVPLAQLPSGIRSLTLDTLAKFSKPAADKPKRELAFLARLQALDALCLCTRLKDLRFLAQVAPLRRFSLWRCGLKELEGIDVQSGIEELELVASGAKDLAPLRALSRLRCLTLQDHRGLKDMRPLAELASLEELSLLSPARDAVLPEDWSGLSQLRVLRLCGVPQLTDLRFVHQLPALRHLVLNDPEHDTLEIFAALRGHPTLRFVGKNVSDEDRKALADAAGVVVKPEWWEEGA